MTTRQQMIAKIISNNIVKEEDEIIEELQQKLNNAIKNKEVLTSSNKKNEEYYKLLEEIDINIKYRKAMLQMWKIKKLYNQKIVSCSNDCIMDANKVKNNKVILEKLKIRHQEYAYEALAEHAVLVEHYDYSEKSHLDLSEHLMCYVKKFNTAYERFINDF